MLTMRPSPLRLLSSAVPTGIPLVRGAVRTFLARAFGPPPFDPAADPGDPGLFGPRAVSWRVIGDPASIFGGIRGLLIQLLHPLAMAGVADHSRFRDETLGRLHRTSAYVTTTTFGSTREALAVAREVRHAHGYVRGTAPDGRPYRADDPYLLAWVSITLSSSFLVTHAAYGAAPLECEEADAFVAEQSRAAALLDPRVDLDQLAADEGRLAALRRGELALPMLEERALPATAAQLDAALEGYRAELEVNEQGRGGLRFLLWPSVSAPLKAGYLPVLAGALATIEPQLRAMLGVPTGGASAAAVRLQTRVTLEVFRTVMGRSPAVAAAARRAAADPAMLARHG